MAHARVPGPRRRRRPRNSTVVHLNLEITPKLGFRWSINLSGRPTNRSPAIWARSAHRGRSGGSISLRCISSPSTSCPVSAKTGVLRPNWALRLPSAVRTVCYRPSRDLVRPQINHGLDRENHSGNQARFPSRIMWPAVPRGIDVRCRAQRTLGRRRSRRGSASFGRIATPISRMRALGRNLDAAQKITSRVASTRLSDLRTNLPTKNVREVSPKTVDGRHIDVHDVAPQHIGLEGIRIKSHRSPMYRLTLEMEGHRDRVSP